jgi:hypothetical protein
MISIKTLQANILNYSRSAWLASLGAIATVSQEGQQMVEKVAQWQTKQPVQDIRNKYQQVLTNMKEYLGSLLHNVPMPKFATAS